MSQTVRSLLISLIPARLEFNWELKHWKPLLLLEVGFATAAEGTNEGHDAPETNV